MFRAALLSCKACRQAGVLRTDIIDNAMNRFVGSLSLTTSAVPVLRSCSRPFAGEHRWNFVSYQRGLEGTLLTHQGAESIDGAVQVQEATGPSLDSWEAGSACRQVCLLHACHR